MSNRWILICACLAGGIGALLAGFSPDWDLLNYHLYNPHALLTGRHAIDIAPGQLQTADGFIIDGVAFDTLDETHHPFDPEEEYDVPPHR